MHSPTVFCYNQTMLNARLLTYFYAMLLVFSQQLVLLHPYLHKADWQQVGYQQQIVEAQQLQVAALGHFSPSDAYDNKQAPGHVDSCSICLVIAGMSSVIATYHVVFFVAPSQFLHAIGVVHSFFSPVVFQYQSRAPPR